MNILLIGSGGREHALAYALKKSPRCKKLYCAPGNPGIAALAECVNIGAEDISTIVKFATDNKIDFVVVGPEGPLVKGLADPLRAAGIAVFGPSEAAAQLEGSKGFMKDLCARYNVPTAAYGRFRDIDAAIKFIKQNGAPIVIKTDGLAAGKGVIIAQTVDEAIDAARGMLSGESFGAAGTEIVIEQFLDGEELSYFAVCDGKTFVPFESAQDHKRAYDNDEGPNTGGMGAYSPAHLMTPELEKKIIERIIKPSVAGLEKDGTPFVGVFFAGIMVVKGEPILLEYNVRFGDPECQTLMLRLESDLVEILYAAATGGLSALPDVKFSTQTALYVVMAAAGYPGAYKKNTAIRGLAQAAQVPHAVVFHAGTAQNPAGEIISVGGRVLGISAMADDAAQARARAYEAVDAIDWPEGFCRRDIGWRAVK